MHVGNVLSDLEYIAETAQDPRTVNYKRYVDWWDYHQDQKSLEREYAKITSVGKQIGWSSMSTMKRVSCMPLHVFVMLRRITNGEFSSNSEEGKRLLHKFLLRRPEFSVRWHI